MECALTINFIYMRVNILNKMVFNLGLNHLNVRFVFVNIRISFDVTSKLFLVWYIKGCFNIFYIFIQL